MIGLIQRVSSAQVAVDGVVIGQIGRGILLLLGVEREDTAEKSERLWQRVVNYRIFADEQGRMNRSLLDIKGELLVVPQFTLPADTRKGNRPSFTPAAEPVLGEALFQHFVALQMAHAGSAQTGRFGADMQVQLVNDGPVTFWLQV